MGVFQCRLETARRLQQRKQTVQDLPYHVIGDVSVYEDATLTIDPGVVVKFGYVYDKRSKRCMLSNKH